MANNNEFVTEFLIESHENLDRLDRDLVELEKDPRDRERLSSVFRTIHTIKGTCGFLGFTKLEAVTHVGENLLSKLRDLELQLDAERTTALLKMIDAIRRMLATIESSGDEGPDEHQALIAELTRLIQPVPAAAESATAIEPVPTAASAAVEVEPVEDRRSPEVWNGEDRRRGEDRRAGEDRRSGDDRRQNVSDSSLRVDVGLLDKLMNLVGELVLARNQILQFTATQTDSGFVGATGRLNLVTSELQEGVMKTRMQPIGNIWSKFPRVVRDLATACGKQVRIEMEGKETDLDKAIIEAIKDPLTHVVRNSVDHGIESPQARVAKGKPAEGCIRMRAFHEGGRINIEISDDGAGVDLGRVRGKALERGLITNEQASRLSEHEILQLIFMPGFSTAEKVTNVSGRGVGMDVVKTNIEKIGGQVDIISKVDDGTTLRIKIPLTLAIIPALMVTSGGERYAIPQVNLLELVRLEGAQATAGIERIQDALFYRLRGNLLPLAYLQRELKLKTAAGSEGSPESDVVNIVVLKADDRQFGLVVEEINDTEEIVVKPLGKQLKGISAFAGATIMGDGRVALILDVMGLAQRASVVSELRDRARKESGADARHGAERTDLTTLLVFRVGESERMAMPLELVDRLEEFPESSIERSGAHHVIQYRDEIVPLISLAKYFTGAESAHDPRQVVVFNDGKRRVGLVVDQILDIVTEPIVVQRRGIRAGVLGSAVVQHKVTDLLDVHALVRDTVPDFGAATAA